MKTYAKEQVQQERLVSVSCDCCGRTFNGDDVSSFIEMQEFLCVAFTGGYGSVFGDGTQMKGDFCQHCVYTLLGNYLRSDYNGGLG